MSVTVSRSITYVCGASLCVCVLCVSGFCVVLCSTVITTSHHKYPTSCMDYFIMWNWSHRQICVSNLPWTTRMMWSACDSVCCMNEWIDAKLNWHGFSNGERWKVMNDKSSERKKRIRNGISNSLPTTTSKCKKFRLCEKSIFEIRQHIFHILLFGSINFIHSSNTVHFYMHNDVPRGNYGWSMIGWLNVCKLQCNSHHSFSIHDGMTVSIGEKKKRWSVYIVNPFDLAATTEKTTI